MIYLLTLSTHNQINYNQEIFNKMFGHKVEQLHLQLVFQVSTSGQVFCSCVGNVLPLQNNIFISTNSIFHSRCLRPAHVTVPTPGSLSSANFQFRSVTSQRTRPVSDWLAGMYCTKVAIKQIASVDTRQIT